MDVRSGRRAIRVGPQGLPGGWTRPAGALGVVVLVDDSANPPARLLARVLHEHPLATLRVDLLPTDEADDRARADDIVLLTHRLLQALQWVRARVVRDADLGRQAAAVFGAGTAAAAALQVAAEQPGLVSALVLLGGRVELAPRVFEVQAPTLLIVGGADAAVLRANRLALQQLQCAKRLEIVPRATALFNEPGALDAVAHLAAEWIGRHGVRRVH